jgi:hypothetical protein
MATDKEKESMRRSYIIIDVLGVKAETKVSDLSVGQLVELLSQLFIQLPDLAVASRDPGKVVEQIRQVFKASGRVTNGGIDEMIRDSQMTILDRIPAAMEAASKKISAEKKVSEYEE